MSDNCDLDEYDLGWLAAIDAAVRLLRKKAKDSGYEEYDWAATLIEDIEVEDIE
jgi:hypothetical protein